MVAQLIRESVQHSSNSLLSLYCFSRDYFLTSSQMAFDVCVSINGKYKSISIIPKVKKKVKQFSIWGHVGVKRDPPQTSYVTSLEGKERGMRLLSMVHNSLLREPGQDGWKVLFIPWLWKVFCSVRNRPHSSPHFSKPAFSPIVPSVHFTPSFFSRSI